MELPDDFAPRRLRRRALEVVALLAALVAVIVFAPGLGEVRHRFRGAEPGWIGAGVALEALSCISYVLLFRPVFCARMSWRSSWEIGWSELGVGSLVPASGAAGVALGAWVLSRGGMRADQIARRSVAFLEIKSAVNFVAVAVLGTLMAVGLVGPHRSLLLTALLAALAVASIIAVAAIGRIGPGAAGGGKLRAARRVIVDGTREAAEILRSPDPLVLTGAIGYWAFDNAVLWATYHAFGQVPPLSIILMGYLVGQLGGLLPIPGGIGGIDLGLIGVLILYGAPAAATVAAVLAYRVILFWLPLVGGAIAFTSLRRGLNQPHRPDLCPA